MREQGLDLRLVQAEGPAPFHEIVELVESTLVREALAITSGNQVKASEILGVNRVNQDLIDHGTYVEIPVAYQLSQGVIPPGNEILLAVFTPGAALTLTPGLSGKIVLELVIAPDGSVQRVRVVSSEIDDPTLVEQVTGRVRAALGLGTYQPSLLNGVT